jgi:hypothetical protein
VVKPPKKIWVNLGVKNPGPLKKASKIKGSEACYFKKYGLKAARRAPQFSKR